MLNKTLKTGKDSRIKSISADTIKGEIKIDYKIGAFRIKKFKTWENEYNNKYLTPRMVQKKVYLLPDNNNELILSFLGNF